MGAVTRTTGLGHHTLRAWERRYGFPRPERQSSGHRRYRQEDVDKLRLIARALAAGHRPSDLVVLSADRLHELVGGGPAPVTDEASWPEVALELARRLDRPGLIRELVAAAARLGARELLRARVEPLLLAVGDAWRAGRLEIRHEHFVSEIVGEVLRATRAPLEAGVSGRPVLLTTLPGEPHALGLQMAALTIVLAGRPVAVLGVQTPVAEIASAASECGARTVGLSVSAATATPATTEAVRELRRTLDPGTHLWLGGTGSRLLNRLPAGCVALPTLDHLERALPPA